MSLDRKLNATGVVQIERECDTITIVEFHASDNVDNLVYAITCDCVCL